MYYILLFYEHFRVCAHACIIHTFLLLLKTFLPNDARARTRARVRTRVHKQTRARVIHLKSLFSPK